MAVSKATTVINESMTFENTNNSSVDSETSTSTLTIENNISKMVQITQNEEEIKILIELNRLITRKPDVILLPRYVKFNSPPIFFERHLAQDVDEVASFCRIFKKEARIILVKKDKGIWPELFQKLSKDELMQKRLEISEQIIERNKERDKVALERFEHKRRTEIQKEIRRETAIRERVKQFEENACREALMVGTRKETHIHPNQKQDKELVKNYNNNTNNQQQAAPQRIGTPATVRSTPVVPIRTTPTTALRSTAKINVCFSNFAFSTPKRESTEGQPRPFAMPEKQSAHDDGKDQLTTLDTVPE